MRRATDRLATLSTIALALAMALALCACGDAPSDATAPPSASESTTPSAARRLTRAPLEVLEALRQADLGEGFGAVAPFIRRADHDRVLELFDPAAKSSAPLKLSRLELWAGIRFDGTPVETIVDGARAAVIWVAHHSSGGWHMTHSAMVLEQDEWRVALVTRFDDLVAEYLQRPGARRETALDAAIAYGESIASDDVLLFLGVISLDDRKRAADKPDTLNRDNSPIIKSFVGADVTAQTASIAVATVTVRFGSKRETAPVALSWIADERSWRVVLKGTPEHIVLLNEASADDD
jgi:hypothetical protein